MTPLIGEVHLQWWITAAFEKNPKMDRIFLWLCGFYAVKLTDFIAYLWSIPSAHQKDAICHHVSHWWVSLWQHGITPGLGFTHWVKIKLRESSRKLSQWALTDDWPDHRCLVTCYYARSCFRHCTDDALMPFVLTLFVCVIVGNINK